MQGFCERPARERDAVVDIDTGVDITWLVAAASGSDAVAFLATQGDPWDTQKDMATCLVGAVMALLMLSHVQDWQIQHEKQCPDDETEHLIFAKYVSGNNDMLICSHGPQARNG